MNAVDLADSAEVLATTFPGADDAPLARALLRLLARGEPVTDGEFAGVAARPPQQVTGVLERWPNVHRDESGCVIAFGGLSLRPTAHRFAVDGRRLFTWCAWDALFLPALLDRTASVRSTCPMTGDDVRLSVQPDAIADAEPSDLRVSFPAVTSGATGDIVGSFCCHVHFLAGPSAARRWLAEHESGQVLSLGDAYELGVRATARLRRPPSAHSTA